MEKKSQKNDQFSLQAVTSTEAGIDALGLPPGLYVVATPIGHMKDITLRALEVLRNATVVAAEDTRKTRQLLHHYGIRQSLMTLHAHNEAAYKDLVVQKIQNGAAVALVSDAGTPAISDPGALLVQYVRSQHLPVFPIPGPSAAIAAMSVAGWLSPQFFFNGFLSHQAAQRQVQLMTWLEVDYPVICYESPHRIVDTLTDCRKCLGEDRQIILAKELTKVFEQVCEGTVDELLQWLTEDKRRGEFVLIIKPTMAAVTKKDDRQLFNLLDQLLNELPLKTAVKIVSDWTGERRNRVYELALERKKNHPIGGKNKTLS